MGSVERRGVRCKILLDILACQGNRLHTLWKSVNVIYKGMPNAQMKSFTRQQKFLSTVILASSQKQSLPFHSSISEKTKYTENGTKLSPPCSASTVS